MSGGPTCRHAGRRGPPGRGQHGRRQLRREQRSEDRRPGDRRSRPGRDRAARLPAQPERPCPPQGPDGHHRPGAGRRRQPVLHRVRLRHRCRGLPAGACPHDRHRARTTSSPRPGWSTTCSGARSTASSRPASPTGPARSSPVVSASRPWCCSTRRRRSRASRASGSTVTRARGWPSSTSSTSTGTAASGSRSATPRTTWRTPARAAGGRRCAAAGLAEGPIARVPWTRDGGYEAGRLLLDAPDPPTAVFACSDLLAVGLLRAGHERGARAARRPRRRQLRRHQGGRVLLAAADRRRAAHRGDGACGRLPRPRPEAPDAATTSSRARSCVRRSCGCRRMTAGRSAPRSAARGRPDAGRRARCCSAAEIGGRLRRPATRSTGART